MVPLAVVRDALCRNFVKPGLKFVQIPRPRYFAAVGQTEREVAEAELLGEETPQIAQKRGRAFPQERVSLSMRACPEFGSARLQDDGSIRHFFTNHAGQFESGVGTQLASAGKLH